MFCLYNMFHLPNEVSVMDATNMEHIPEQCFDLIIDKGKQSLRSRL
jgi:hypothetical protein